MPVKPKQSQTGVILRGQVEVNGFTGLEGGHGLADGNGARFHK